MTGDDVYQDKDKEPDSRTVTEESSSEDEGPDFMSNADYLKKH